jgi:hypothetical protein
MENNPVIDEIREKIKKGELICPLCNKPIREDEILSSTGPESFYHWHCLHAPNNNPPNPTYEEVVDGERRIYSTKDSEWYFHAGWTWDGKKGQWYRKESNEEVLAKK